MTTEQLPVTPRLTCQLDYLCSVSINVAFAIIGPMPDGIRLNASSMDNTIHDNHLRDNVTHDCHDDGMGNIWVGNHGETENIAGLCTRDPDDASFETSTVYGWDPAYPWYDAFDVAADFDWATAYATIDIESLLQLVPQVQIPGIRRAAPSPNQ